MIKEFKNRFMQGTLLTILWLMCLTSLIFGSRQIELNYFWRIISISAQMSLVFSVGYTYVWNYGTWPAPINILATSLANFGVGYLSVYIYSRDLFGIVLPFWWLILTITVLLHIVIFYFWRRHQNKQLAQDLNELTKG